jgi:3-deoxy-D-manno-octulosonic-acid transferase
MIFDFFYGLGIAGLKWGMKLVALFNDKVRRGVQGRAGLIQNLEVNLPNQVNGRKTAWFHAASLGEFEQGRPVIEAFRDNFPDFFIIVTFFSPSGYEVRKNYEKADHICYLPLDSRASARRFVQVVNPRIVFFIKYEFWYNYLRELHLKGVPIVVFSAIFRPDQLFFKPYGAFYLRLLSWFSHILVQNQTSLELLRNAGIARCSLAGDTRFDRVRTIASNARDLPEIERFVNGAACLVAGSVWEADMDVLIPALNESHVSIKTIIAPHEIKRAQMDAWGNRLSGRAVFYSDYVNRETDDDFQHLIIDNVGMLSSLYKYGTIAYIGGSFGSGLHNILEAATFGIPVLFGNRKFHKFQEAKELIALGGAIAVDGKQLVVQLLEMFENEPEIGEKMGAINKCYVAEEAGATQIVLEKVKDLLNA